MISSTQADPASASERDKHLAQLLAKCDQGDEKAFEALYSLCSRQLYGVLLRILRIEAIAEEALQDSFVKIWQKAGMYIPDEGPPMSWMFSIARHQALDLLRKRTSREDLERADLHGYTESTADTTKPFREMVDAAAPLMLCLDQLPEEVRHCIVSAYCEGYSQEELSIQADKPIGTVKSWIRRGLIALRTCLDGLP